MKRFLLVLILFTAIQSFSQTGNFVEHYNHLVFSMYRETLVKHTNQVFSPYFIVQDFAPLYLGAKGNTRLQLKYFFGFSDNLDQFKKDMQDFKQIANVNNGLSTRMESFVGIIIEDSLKKFMVPEFKQEINKFLVDSIVFADLHNATEQVRFDLNSFVRHSAINLLPNPIFNDPVSFKGGMLLVSSVLFTGNWQKNFTEIYRAPFYLDKYGRKTKSLPYLTVNGYFKYVQGINYQVVEIPYEGNKLSLMIILPNEDMDLLELQKQITYEDYKLVADGLTLQRLRIFLPVLEINSFFDLKDELADELSYVFAPGANFTNMIKKMVWVDHVYHAVNFSIKPEKELRFVRFMDLQKEQTLGKVLFINRPFIFFVKDNETNSILFIGHVFKPI